MTSTPAAAAMALTVSFSFAGQVGHEVAERRVCRRERGELDRSVGGATGLDGLAAATTASTAPSRRKSVGDEKEFVDFEAALVAALRPTRAALIDDCTRRYCDYGPAHSEKYRPSTGTVIVHIAPSCFHPFVELIVEIGAPWTR